METALCAAPTEQRAAAPADPLAVHGIMIEVEALLAAADALLGTCGEFRISATRDDPEYTKTHKGSAEADLRRAVMAAKAVLDAEDAA